MISEEITSNEANLKATSTSDVGQASKASPVASHVQETANQTNDDDDDCQEQVVSLLRALELLSEIAADSSSSSAASRALNELQTSWKLEDTHIPQLRNSIERLQSNMQLLQQDADSHGEQMQTLQHELYDNSIHIRKLEKAVKKLHKKNARLQQQVEQHKQSLARQVKKYVVKKNADEQRHQLIAHERLLKLENTNRSRCSSRDTDFSGADMVALQYEDELSVESSASSVSTTPSFVTDEGVATVRYSPALVEDERTLTDRKKVHDYDLTFPQGTKIGLQFHKVQLEKTQRGLLNDAIQEKAPAAECATTPSKELQSFSRHFNFDALRGKHHEDDYAYLVCGHYGFDRDMNTQPQLGARLVKVNGESVEHMTLDKIKAAIKCTKCEFFSLTFRNEALSAKQKEILDSAIIVTRQQYEERHPSESSNGEASAENKGQHPVIICMHEEGTSRLSSFLYSARSRTYSDTAVKAGLANSERGESSREVAVSPSVKSFYSILHGDTSVKTDLDAVISPAKLSSGERESSSEDVGPSETPRSRLSSMFNSGRNRTLSDNAVPVEVASGEREEATKDIVTSPSGRGLYSFLHGDDTGGKVDSNLDTPADLAKSGREGSSEDVSATDGTGSRLSSMFNSVRSRTYSDSAVPDDLPSSDRVPTSSEDVGTPVGTPESTPGKRLSSFIHGTRSRDDLDHVVVVENATDQHGSPLRNKPAGVEMASPLSHGTPPSQKLKKGMKSVGSKFKSLF